MSIMQDDPGSMDLLVALAKFELTQAWNKLGKNFGVAAAKLASTQTGKPPCGPLRVMVQR